MQRLVKVAGIALCVAACASAATDALVVVHKTVSSLDVVLGEEVTVGVLMQNHGEETLFDVKLEDGEHTKAVDTLEAGANVTIEYKVTPTALGPFPVAQAAATFATSPSAEQRVRAVSNEVREEKRDERRHATEVTPRGFVLVMTADEYEQLHTRYIKEAVLYLIQAAVLVGVPYFIAKQKQTQLDLQLRDAKKK